MGISHTTYKERHKKAGKKVSAPEVDRNEFYRLFDHSRDEASV